MRQIGARRPDGRTFPEPHRAAGSSTMSLQEIEAAIERLPPDEYATLLARIHAREAEDASDIAALEQSVGEPTEPFETVVARMRADGLL